MTDQKDDKRTGSKKQEKPRDGNSGGNMGAGRSGKEGMGSQKPGQPRT
jgi:hypothetical protein